MSFFAGLNAWGILLAAAASFIFGGLWYGILSKAWLDAAGLDPDQVENPRGASPRPFVIAFVAQLVMACLMAKLLQHLGRIDIPLHAFTGALVAFCAWLGFMLPPLVVNYQFQMRKPALTLIDSGHWLGVALIQGAILGPLGLS